MTDFEQIDIVDENNNVIGSTNASTAHAQKLRHRIAGVFLFDTDGNLYVQTGNKYGKYDLSVGGHVRAGESYENAAQREMFEELGLQVPIRHVSTFLPKDARLNHYWAIYESIAPDEWKFTETEEVRALEKMNVSDIVAAMDADPEKFTHGFVNAMREFVRLRGTHCRP